MTHVSNPNGDTKIELQTSSHHPTPPESLRQDSIDQDFQRTSTNQDFNKKNNRPRQAYAKKAGFISLLHFFFVVKLVRFINSLKGRSITEEDLKPLVYSWRCQPMENLFTQYYYEFRTKYQGQVKLIAKVLFEIFKREIYIQIFWQIVYICARILIPYFLFLSLTSLRNPLEPLVDAYKPAIGMFICFLVSHYSFHQWNFNAAFASNAAKIGLLGMLFRKINKISLLSLQKLSFGKLINVAANDANNLENMHYMFFVPLLPLSYGGAIVLLVYWWGASGLVPIGYMIMINVYQYFMSQKVIPPGRQRSFFADERIRKIFEILESIRIVKMQTWESYFIDEVYKTRATEIGGLKKVNYLVSFIRAVTYSSQYIAAFLLLVTYNQVSGPITSAKIFPSILLLGFLKQFAMIYCQVGFIYSVLLLSISLRTISIMDLPEVRPEKEILSPESPENSVEFRDFSGYWTKKDLGEPPFIKPPPPNPPKPAPPEASISPTPAVSKINLDIKTGELVAIVGQTGAGKSSLLLSFTREMIKTEGELRFAGTLDYVAQEPIVLSHSIKESISYGKKYDDELFWKVVDACCLKDMIDSLPKKELTQMAERGVNLSEAQKIQITLARALYSKADIYLLDDPFSSFDQRLGKLIFRKAIQEFLKDSTVILVTHNLNFVKHANKIVIMQAGSIIAQGTYSELAQKETSSKIIEELQRRVKYEKRDLESFGQGRQYDEVYNPLLGRGESAMKERPAAEDETAIDLVEDDNGLFIEDERLDDGKVTLKIYWAYIRTVFNWWNCIPLIILFAAPEAAGWQFMLRVSDWLLGDYSDSEAYGILATIAFGALIVHLIKYLVYYTFALNGVKNLHNKMLRGILHSPMKFFDRNRIGRIINRFANDISQLDRFLLPAFIDILEGICYFTIYLIALWIQELWILIPAAIAFVGFMITFLYFRKSINAARGLELTVRGPVYSFFSSVFNGATIFRVRDQTENIMKAFYRRADDYARANVAYKTTLRLQSFVLDYITELTVIGTYCFYISQKGNTIVNGTFVNMLISLPTTMQWLLRNFAAFHAMMAATARIINYCQNHKGVEMVKPGDEKLKQSGWPHRGEIDIKDASMRYGENKPLVIKNLNAQIKPGEKVAVVGPSSFGMTSIINMITRILHIEPKPDAHINIDGVSVKDIGVTLNRRSMTIITQQYYVFTGTIRQNIDPCKKHSDDEIWNALDVAGLKEHIEALDAKLDTYFVRGSSLFSAGQRQMLSLARALLKKDTSILIQDRATNHVDIVTDHFLQKRLKERYPDLTTLMTTFRLWHVAECDRVLCMKNGIKTEFDEPYRLLVKEIGDKEITNKHGHFARLVLDMNPKIVKQTFKIAMIAYYKRHNMPLDNIPGGPEVSGPCGEAKDVSIFEEERRQIQGDWEDLELIRRASSKRALQAAKRDLLV